MNELTINEKRIIFHILILIMNADLHVHPAETAFIDKIFTQFGLDYSEFDHIENLDWDNIARDFGLLSDEARKYAESLFWEMAKCDGYIDPREEDLIHRLMNVS